ncbi:hypothetical protein LOKG_00025 [Loktanella phage pCB2051-A]|uniref:Uncharacterized protein n=1 Tax=Loktanella phage pCB2051-A TaxID=754044 RepID=M4R165_9CAUD|nr:hypothetical protein LOKG_00025 [Loktanella phage pCB2051-A]AGH31462.1 hypothetical protein LOKG_00025 [Loktanella phage pCB2051-A]
MPVMADQTVPYPEVGLAAFEQLDNFDAGLLLSGSWPSLAPGHPFAVTADLELKMFEVVGLVGNKLVAATDTIQAIGVMTQAVTGNSAGTTTVPVFLSGCFNPAMLVWDDSFADMASKLNAFMGAPSPTQILVRERG